VVLGGWGLFLMREVPLYGRTRQSRPDFGLGVQSRFLETFQVVATSLKSG